MTKKKEPVIEVACAEAKVDLDTKPVAGIEIKEKISRADMAKMISDDLARQLNNNFHIQSKKLDEANQALSRKLRIEVEKELKKFLTSFKGYAECRVERVNVQDVGHRERGQDNSGYTNLYHLREKGIIVCISVRFKEAYSCQYLYVHLPLTCKAYAACKEEVDCVELCTKNKDEARIKYEEFHQNASALKSDITKSMLGASRNGQKILDGLEAVKAQILENLNKPKQLT